MGAARGGAQPRGDHVGSSAALHSISTIAHLYPVRVDHDFSGCRQWAVAVLAPFVGVAITIEQAPGIGLEMRARVNAASGVRGVPAVKGQQIDAAAEEPA